MRRLTREEKFMREAIKTAKRGLKEGEVPIGAVVVYEDKIVSRGYNRRAKLQLASAHAEMMAIDKACKKFHSWRLPEGCELYVTLEPCPMCAGALGWSQIGRIVYGASDPKRGFSTISGNILHPRTVVTSGILAEECERLMVDFFAKLR